MLQGVGGIDAPVHRRNDATKRTLAADTVEAVGVGDDVATAL